VSWFGADLAGKRLALFHDVVPNISTIGFLTNPSDPDESSQPADGQDAARQLNLKLVVINASTEREIDAAFATFAQQQVGAVVIASDPFFLTRREQIVSLAARQRMPGIYSVREYVAAGGLMSYGNNLREAYRHAELYVGRILRGAKPSDLPVERLTKFEFVINLTTAKALGLTVPASFLSLADELIE
jgi:putative tryptophan/tyrosine transport system substrate-binding protein